MDQLSMELLLLISSMVDKEDLPNVRLVSRSLASAGMQYLTIGGQIVFRDHSFRRLRNIAEHPIMSARLTNIQFMIDVVPKFLDQEAWESQASAICHGPWKFDPVALDWLKTQQIDVESDVQYSSKRFRELGWQHQQSIRDEQEIMLRNSKTTFELLKKSLARLPNLRNLVIESLGVGYEKLSRPLFTVKRNQAWYCFNVELDEKLSNLISHHFSSTLSAAHMLCHAHMSSTSPLISLKMSATDFLESRYDPGLLTNLAMLRNVQYLFLASVDSPGYRADEVDNWNDREELEALLECLLRSMQDLSTLGLDIDLQSRFRLDAVVKKHYWSCLGTLQLSYLDINQELIEEFLILHSKTLFSIYLGDCNLEPKDPGSDTWIEVFMFIRDKLNLSLLQLSDRLLEQGCIEFNTTKTAEMHDFQKIQVSEMTQWLVCGVAPHRYRPSAGRNIEQVTWVDLEVAYERS